MPTYNVSTVGVSLSEGQQAEIAELITASHHENTGAPGFFAQVFFIDHHQKHHYLGGKRNSAPHVFIHGLIRGGRSIDAKKALMAAVVEGAARICSVGNEDVWMYIQDIDAEQMIEYGRVLPQPGEEAAWRSGISKEKEAALVRDGVDL